MAGLNPNYLNFAILRAPIDTVTAATGGIMRADGNGAGISAETTQPDMRAITPKGRYDCRKYALVAAVGDAVLVEFCYMHNLPLGLSLMMPEIEVLSFRSNWETQKRGYDLFEVYREGLVMRRLEVEQGWETTQLKVTEEGKAHAFEPARRPRSKRNWLNQDALLAMAERAAPGSRHAMERRAFGNVTAFTAFSAITSLRDDTKRERTTLYQAEYEAARRLGIGKDEKSLATIQDENAWMDQIEALTAFTWKAADAFHKAASDPAKARVAYEAALSDPERPPGYVPTYDLTHGLDQSRAPDAYGYLERQETLWKIAQELNSRIQQTLWAMPEHAEHDLLVTQDVPARAIIGLNNGRYADIEGATRSEASKLLKSVGIAFEPDDPVFSKARSFASIAGHLVMSHRSFADEVNSDITSDLTIKPGWSIKPDAKK